MIFVPNMLVLPVAGKYAGKKGVVLKNLDDNYVVVAGIQRLPKKSEDYMSKAEKRKNDKFLVFIKKYNVRHLEATRYKADLGNDAIDFTGFEDIKNRPTIKKRIVEAFSKLKEGNKAKWMFRELKF